MNVLENSRLMVAEEDGLTFRFEPSPNFMLGSMKQKYLVIHSTEGPNVQAAIFTFKSISGGKSAHLILSRDGKEVVQMVDFNRRAQHIDILNPRAIGLELDYTGPLTQLPQHQGLFNHISNFQPGEVIYAVALNDRVTRPDNIRAWPRYPEAQLDALVPLALTLASHYGLQVVGHEELRSFKVDPGPAFPVTRFQEILLGREGGSVLYDEIAQDVELRTGPGMVYPLLPAARLVAGTPVTTTSDFNGWGLVEVMADVDGSRWLVGWAPLETIIPKQAQPVIQNHRLFTSDGRQYQYVPAHPKKFAANHKVVGPKYLIIHTTDAISVESTIHTFTGEKGDAAAHLVIGRDGRVVQFVDFDTVAFHCGTSYWEQDFDLNRSSIGIEVDNAGFLSRSDGVWKWKTTIIPDEEVTEIRHWKENGKRGWQQFTDVQIKVLREIVQALKERYGFEIVLGHDVINLTNRADPGPLFPMQEFQELVGGEPGVLVEVYETSAEAKVYKNTDQRPPDLAHPRHSGRLPVKTKVLILDHNDDWTRVKVKSETGPFRNTEGWIRNHAVDASRGTTKTTRDSDYFKVNPNAIARSPWTLSRQSPLLPGTRVRIEKFEAEFALIVALDRFLEGWVEKSLLTRIGVERIAYPPLTRRRRGPRERKS